MLSFEYESPALSTLKNTKIMFEVQDARIKNINLHPRDQSNKKWRPSDNLVVNLTPHMPISK